ncbi:hypothetical protein [Embleya sp. NPDC059237]
MGAGEEGFREGGVLAGEGFEVPVEAFLAAAACDTVDLVAV